MKHRDLAWRGLGAGLITAAATLRIADGDSGHVIVSLFGFSLMLAGLVLVIQGKRVSAALRVECGRHRLLAQTIRDRRRSRSGDRRP